MNDIDLVSIYPFDDAISEVYGDAYASVTATNFLPGKTASQRRTYKAKEFAKLQKQQKQLLRKLGYARAYRCKAKTHKGEWSYTSPYQPASPTPYVLEVSCSCREASILRAYHNILVGIKNSTVSGSSYFAVRTFIDCFEQWKIDPSLESSQIAMWELQND